MIIARHWIAERPPVRRLGQLMRSPKRFLNWSRRTLPTILVSWNKDSFQWPVTRSQALQIFDHFTEERLESFGDFQDAMVLGKDTLYHSLISTSLNLGLLSPLGVCFAAENAFRDGAAPINAVEGFIRQIIGWREYVRGLYWAYMPEYKDRNTLNASWPLPSFFGTKRRPIWSVCLRQYATQDRMPTRIIFSD